MAIEKNWHAAMHFPLRKSPPANFKLRLATDPWRLPGKRVNPFPDKTRRRGEAILTPPFSPRPPSQTTALPLVPWPGQSTRGSASRRGRSLRRPSRRRRGRRTTLQPRGRAGGIFPDTTDLNGGFTTRMNNVPKSEQGVNADKRKTVEGLWCGCPGVNPVILHQPNY